MMAATTPEWTIDIETIWRMVEGLVALRFGDYVNASKIDLDDKLRATVKTFTVPSFLGEPIETKFSNTPTKFDLGDIYQISTATPLLKMIANTKVGFYPQQFQFDGGVYTFSSNLNVRSEGLGGKGSYEELYVNVPGSSKYSDFVENIRNIGLIDGLDLDTSEIYKRWEEKKIIELRYESEIDDAKPKKRKKMNPGVVTVAVDVGAVVRGLHDADDLLDYLGTLDFDLDEKKHKVLKTDRSTFRATKLAGCHMECPVTVTFPTVVEKARSLRRLIKGTHNTKRDPFRSKTLEGAAAIMGVAEGYRSPSNVAHLLTMLTLLKHQKVTLDDFKSETSPNHWVPREKDASSKLVDYSDNIWNYISGTTPPSAFTAPFRKNLLELLKLEIAKRAGPIKRIHEINGSPAAVVEAQTEEEAQEIVRAVIKRRLIRHL